jgi:F0F1-type ATP synthase membrane subunit b/b'
MFHIQDALSHAESKVAQTETQAEDLAKKLKQKDEELQELKDRWRDETNTIHQQTREEINSEREKLLKVLIVISEHTLILFQNRECISFKNFVLL